MKTAPAWVDRQRYPFTSRWLSIDDNELHYIDEGKGDVIMFVHGTPEWSFAYRDVVKALRDTFRCVAIDLLGFGLSDKAPGEFYTCAAHSERLEKFIKQLELKNITIVANDFGGSIAMRYVLDHPENIRKIVLSNTWMRSLKNEPHYARPARLIRTLLGKFLYVTLNAPVNTIMPAAYGDKKKLTKQNHQHYKHALPSGSRKGPYGFGLEMSHANDWWQGLWDRLDTVRDKPFLIFWGLKDSFVLPAELNHWKLKLPAAHYIIFDDAGHFVQEEKPEEMAAAIRTFLTSP